MGYNVAKERVNNCAIVENTITLMQDRRDKFLRTNKDLQHDLLIEGYQASEPLLVLQGIMVGLKRQTSFSD